METPRGQLVIQTIAMPKDTNANGDIFGGWMLSQMDLASGVLAKQVAQGRVATVAVDSMVFHLPVKIGDLVSCYAELLRIGTTSMTILVEVFATKATASQAFKVTEGIFTCVAIDDEGKPRKVVPD